MHSCRTTDAPRFTSRHGLIPAVAWRPCRAVLLAVICTPKSGLLPQGRSALPIVQTRRSHWGHDCRRAAVRPIVRRGVLPCSRNRRDRCVRLWVKKVVLQDHFGRHVFGTAAEGVGELPLEHVGLGQTQVGYFDVSVLTQEDVFRFDIAVDYVILV